MFRRIRRPTTLSVNYESTPLLSSILTPQCLFTSPLFTPALPLLPATPVHLSSRKKTKKKITPKFSFHPSAFNPPPDSPYSPIRLIIVSSGSIHLGLLSATYLITSSQQSPAFVMGDNATEIDLDSVIDRLLEGAFLLLGSRKHNIWIWELSILHIPRIVGILPMWLTQHGPMSPLSYTTACFRSPRILEGVWAAGWFATPGLTAFRWRRSENRCFSSDIPILKSSRSCDGCSQCLVQYEEIDLGSLSSSKSTRSNTFAPKPAKFSLISLSCWS